MIIICTARIPACTIVICKTYVFRTYGYIVGKLHVKAGIPSDLLEHIETVPAEFAPVWFNRKMDGKRGLRYPVIHLSAGTQHGDIGPFLNLARGHDPLPECKCKTSDLVGKRHFRNEIQKESVFGR